MADKTTLASSLQAMWLDGYLQAVACMRDWADEFADAQVKQAIINCADMVEAAQPTKEMLGG